MTRSPGQPILLVEDSAVAVEMVRQSLRDGGLVNRVDVVANGDEAHRYLSVAADAASHRYRPVLVLLDVNLPGPSGIEVLEWMRSQRALEDVPVVVMSASSAVDPIEDAHRLGAEAFLVKPVAYDALMDVITRLRLPWALQGRWERDGDG